MALLHPVDPLALLVADGFDREFHLLRDRAGDEAPDRMRLPLGDLGDLGRGCPLLTPKQFDYGALLRSVPRLRLPGLGAGLACLGAGAVFAAAGFAPVLAVGAAFFWLALVVALAVPGATAAPCGVTAAVPAAVVATAFVMSYVLSSAPVWSTPFIERVATKGKRKIAYTRTFQYKDDLY